MTALNHLAMASAVVNNSNLEIKKSLFGLKTTIIYKPTGSPVRITKSECTALTGSNLERVLNGDKGQLKNAVKAFGHFHSSPVGQYMLESVRSDDGNFAMLRLYRFQELNYTAVTGVKVFEGDDAKTINQIF